MTTPQDESSPNHSGQSDLESAKLTTQQAHTPTIEPNPLTSRASISGRLVRLCLKELREILRDRRTIITLILMPLLVYPILSLIFNKLILTGAANIPGSGTIEARLGFQNEEEADQFKQLLGSGSVLLADQGFSTNDIDNLDLRYDIYENRLEQTLADGEIDVAVQRFPSDANQNTIARWMLKRRANSALGEQLIEFCRRRMAMVNQSVATRLLDSARLPRANYSSFEVEVIHQGDGQLVSLTSFIPLMLILMTITGAVYPAIDLTAGERERGTMEALIAAPIPRLGLLLAKYVAVVFVALLTAVANLTAMTVTLYATGLQDILFGEVGLSAATLIQIFGLLVLFSAFFASVLLAITSFARSFKEAQAYLIPLMLLSLGPGIISLSPDIQLTPMWAVTPLINIVLVARDLFANDFDPTMGLIAMAATSLYALAALSLAARVFGTDAVLYGSQKGWRDLITRPIEPRTAATIPSTLLCFAILFAAVFYALGSLAQFPDLSMGRRLTFSALISFVIFVCVPLLFAWQGHVQLKTGFNLNPGSLGTWLAAIPLALSLWTISYELVLLSENMGLVSLSSKQPAVDKLLNAWDALPFYVIMLTLGVTPAVVEEFFFRGFLFRSLQVRFPAAGTIILSALAFGAFHVIGANILTPERFLPSAFLGLALGWMAWKSKSILPGILLHAIHNSIMLRIAYDREQIESLGLFPKDMTHLPWTWHAAAATAIILGMALTLIPKRTPPPSA